MFQHVPACGDVLGGRFQILRSLGQGGMGAVFEAENLVTHKHVAIKWMRSTAEECSEAAQRFIREAQATARLRHPNVVDIYDVVQEQDVVFLIMELLDGEPLSALLTCGGMPLPDLVALLLPAMRGVAAAHKQGVIHRDIKPDNIFLARQADRVAPCPKVLDFGISKLHEEGGMTLTRTGTALGTPLYMSFEQVMGSKDLDGRTDVYSFGVILYEAATGTPPFDASTLTDLAVKMATQTPSAPDLLRPELPTALVALIQRALARQREERPATLEELIRELEPFAAEDTFRAAMATPSAALPSVVGHIGRDASKAVVQSATKAQGSAPVVPTRTLCAPVYRSAVPIGPTAAYSTGPRQVADRTLVSLQRKPSWIVLGALGLGGLLLLGVLSISRLHFGGESEHAGPPRSGEQSSSLGIAAPKRLAAHEHPVDVAPTSERADSPPPQNATKPPPQNVTKPRPQNATKPPPQNATKSAAIKPPSRKASPTVPQRNPTNAKSAAVKPLPWKPLAMPWRSPLDKLFQDSAQTQRRKRMLRDGPPYRSVAEAKRAFDQGQLKREAYEDVVWTLKVWRTHAVEEVAASRARGAISAEEQRRQQERIEKLYSGR